MAKKLSNIKSNQLPNSVLGYHAFNSENRIDAAKKQSVAMERYKSINRTSGSSSDIVTRPAFDRDNFKDRRPCDADPSRFRDIVYVSRTAYWKIGIIRNVIDLMTDFACEDLKIVHPDKKAEAFFKVWMAKVNMQEVIDEFVRHFLVDGNVVVKRSYAKLTQPVETQWMERSMASDPERLYTEKKANVREIPWRYNFLNITALEWGKDISVSKKQLMFRLSHSMSSTIKTPNLNQVETVNKIPLYITESVKKGNDLIPLDMDTIYVAHNKKDSWEDWALPYLYAVLSDLKFKEKLKQADAAALDGLINVIRIWKLGDHKEGFFPEAGAVDKLFEILDTNTGGGAIDIVWDSMIEVDEFYPPVKDILGQEKYKEVDKDILIGLGIPEVLIGGSGSNFSNSWIQLKTLVEKLKYVRRHLKQWLYEEVHILCEAMNIETAPKIKFNQMNLEDENIARKLIVSLWDRGIVSTEAVLNMYGEDFLIEMERIPQEKKSFDKLGIETFSPLDTQKETDGQPGQGRPPATKDVNRKERTPKVRRASSSLTVTAYDIVEKIDEVITSIYLDSNSISNGRKLTSENRSEIDKMRQAVLSSFKPGDDISEESVINKCSNLRDIMNSNIIEEIVLNIDAFIKETSKEPTLPQKKKLEALAWANIYSGEDYVNG